MRNLNQNKSHQCKNQRIFPFSKFFFVAWPCYDNIKCVNHHREEYKSRKIIYQPHEWFQNIIPKFPPPFSINNNRSSVARIFEKRRPNRIRHLKQNRTRRCPGDIIFPFFHIFVASVRCEQFYHANNQKNHRNKQHRVFDSLRNIKKCRTKRIICICAIWFDKIAFTNIFCEFINLFMFRSFRFDIIGKIIDGVVVVLCMRDRYHRDTKTCQQNEKSF